MDKINTSDSWLLQRIKAPDNSHQEMNFGGGGSGLSPGAMAVIAPIMGFDYMGYAEFEFGVLVKCLNNMALQRLELWEHRLEHMVHVNPTTFYIVSPEADKQYIIQLLHNLGNGTQRCKGSPRFSDVVGDGDDKGWIDLTQGSLITVDREMAEKFIKIFD